MGDGVAQNFERAAEWYLQAAEQGDALAQFNLGRMYRFGEGVEKDMSTAALWYQ
ncbi:MAG: SEL1-like repeat protein, partial [Gammaproteobacteria bacterium]|nr:SEL1-like repeat protein [Gammaproteobacteria bacterium]